MNLELSKEAIKQLDELEATITTSVKRVDTLLTDINSYFYKNEKQLGPHQEEIDQILKRYNQYFGKEIEEKTLALTIRIGDTKQRIENLVKRGLLP